MIAPLLLSVRVRLFAIAMIVACAANVSRATVTLIFDDGDASPTGTTVAPGASFTFGVYVNSTAEETSGLNYFLLATGAGSGRFQITGRDTSLSPYNDLTVPDSTNTTGVLTPARALLNPVNDDDLGGGLPQATINNPPAIGKFLAAKFTVQVLPGTFAGSYSLLTASDAGTGWIGSNNDPSGTPFSDHPFSNQNGIAYTVTVTPEPGVLSLMALCVVVLPRRRKRVD
jgi:hypothetical protein